MARTRRTYDKLPRPIAGARLREARSVFEISERDAAVGRYWPTAGSVDRDGGISIGLRGQSEQLDDAEQINPYFAVLATLMVATDAADTGELSFAVAGDDDVLDPLAAHTAVREESVTGRADATIALPVTPAIEEVGLVAEMAALAGRLTVAEQEVARLRHLQARLGARLADLQSGQADGSRATSPAVPADPIRTIPQAPLTLCPVESGDQVAVSPPVVADPGGAPDRPQTGRPRVEPIDLLEWMKGRLDRGVGSVPVAQLIVWREELAEPEFLAQPPGVMVLRRGIFRRITEVILHRQGVEEGFCAYLPDGAARIYATRPTGATGDTLAEGRARLGLVADLDAPAPIGSPIPGREWSNRARLRLAPQPGLPMGLHARARQARHPAQPRDRGVTMTGPDPSMSAAEETLNPEQLRAVYAPSVPLLVQAGAGCGKTETMVRRAVQLVRKDRLAAREMLFLVFTTAAARILRRRLSAALGIGQHELSVHTFDAYSLAGVRRHHQLVGFRHPPAIIGGIEAGRALVETCAGAGVPCPPHFTTQIASEVARVRAYRALHGDWPTALARAVRVAECHSALLRRRNLLDHQAAQSLWLLLLQRRPALLRDEATCYAHIFCDEFQDVAHPQWLLLRLLADRHRRLSVVGDPLQAIFGWRGGDGGYIHHFADQFPGGLVLPLRQNYRSTRAVIGLANHLAALLPYGQPLQTSAIEGRIPELIWFAREVDEAAFIAREIRRIRDALNNGRPGTEITYRDFAILCRNRRQLPPIAAVLEAAHIPWGGPDAESDRVRLGTIHGAKGEQWQVVFGPGIEEGLLPGWHAVADAESGRQLREEIHAAYVLVTRAARRLYLTACRRRLIDGELRETQLSRFFAGVPAAVLNIREEAG